MPGSENSAARIGWVECNRCGEAADLMPGQGADPDAALTCPPGSGCCQEQHSHAGDGCDRTIAVYGVATISGEGN